MRIITCVGYYYTGSGAVTDYLKEFNNICFVGKGEQEIRFVQDPGGISDLTYNLVENNHRHNSSNAIKEFVRYAKYLNGSFYTKRYRNYFGDGFFDCTMKYVEKITQLKAKNWWHYDQYKRGNVFLFFDLLLNSVFKAFGKKGRVSLLKGREVAYYTAIDKEKYYKLTRDYIDDLFSAANPECKPYVVAEQVVPPSNNNRYVNFFNDIRVIIVDRDPRDVYINIKETTNEGVIPIDSVRDFCTWYDITRKHREYEKKNPNVLYIQFEDLIYHYKETTMKINNFIGLKETNHIAKYSHFNPKVSIKGTHRFAHNKKYANDIKYIEAHLAKYLYEF